MGPPLSERLHDAVQVLGKLGQFPKTWMSSSTTKPFCCPQCGKGFTWKSGLVAHEATHVPYHERPYVCKIDSCGKRFVDKASLEQHCITHEENRPRFTCSFPGCDKSFLKQRSLVKHKQLFHGLGNRVENTRQHQRRSDDDESGEKKAEAEEVAKEHRSDSATKPFNMFRNPNCSHVGNHSLNGSAELLYACDEPGCSRSFYGTRWLNAHQRWHQGLPHLQCRDCNEQTAPNNPSVVYFYSKAELQQHQANCKNRLVRLQKSMHQQMMPSSTPSSVPPLTKTLAVAVTGDCPATAASANAAAAAAAAAASASESSLLVLTERKAGGGGGGVGSKRPRKSMSASEEYSQKHGPPLPQNNEQRLKFALCNLHDIFHREREKAEAEVSVSYGSTVTRQPSFDLNALSRIITCSDDIVGVPACDLWRRIFHGTPNSQRFSPPSMFPSCDRTLDNDRENRAKHPLGRTATTSYNGKDDNIKNISDSFHVSGRGAIDIMRKYDASERMGVDIGISCDIQTRVHVPSSNSSTFQNSASCSTSSFSVADDAMGVTSPVSSMLPSEAAVSIVSSSATMTVMPFSATKSTNTSDAGSDQGTNTERNMIGGTTTATVSSGTDPLDTLYLVLGGASVSSPAGISSGSGPRLPASPVSEPVSAKRMKQTATTMPESMTTLAFPIDTRDASNKSSTDAAGICSRGDSRNFASISTSMKNRQLDDEARKEARQGYLGGSESREATARVIYTGQTEAATPHVLSASLSVDMGTDAEPPFAGLVTTGTSPISFLLMSDMGTDPIESEFM